MIEETRQIAGVEVHTCSEGEASVPSERYLCPTIITGCAESDKIMQEEIFGPVLPVLCVPDVDSALRIINGREKPLALYVFSKANKVIQQIIEGSSSGAVVANDTMMHCAVSALPFGGVGHSGMGAYHGKHSFDTFSHSKAVMIKDFNLEQVMALRYPPYNATKRSLLGLVMSKSVQTVRSRLITAFIVAFCLAAAVKKLALDKVLKRLLLGLAQLL